INLAMAYFLYGSRIVGGSSEEHVAKAMTDDLEKSYNGDTRAFATHLEKLFEDNTSIGQFPFVTSEVYMLLLFEIARRQVKDSDESTDKK
ncbi:hypothetical protein OS493_002670, partial [Desmophyllum pertusum]